MPFEGLWKALAACPKKACERPFGNPIEGLLRAFQTPSKAFKWLFEGLLERLLKDVKTYLNEFERMLKGFLRASERPFGGLSFIF